MNQVIEAYRSITTTSEFQEIERLRSKARHDEAQALHHAGRVRALSIAENLLKKQMPIKDIIDATGLTHEEVYSLSAD